MRRIKISMHALQRYCFRKYDNQFYYMSHPGIEEELRQRVLSSRESKYKPKMFFRKCKRKGVRVKDVKLLEDNEFVYAIRDNTLITVLNIPGNDIISDFFMFRRFSNVP